MRVAQTTPELAEIIRRYCDQLDKFGIACERVLLFGSQAKGTAHEYSDIDLIVVSSDWTNYNLRERLELLGVAAARILEPIQAYGATPDEIANHQLSPFWEYILDEEAVAVA